LHRNDEYARAGVCVCRYDMCWAAAIARANSPLDGAQVGVASRACASSTPQPPPYSTMRYIVTQTGLAQYAALGVEASSLVLGLPWCVA